MTSTIPIKTLPTKAIQGQYVKPGTTEPVGDRIVVDKNSQGSMYIHHAQDLILHEMTDEEYEAWRDSQRSATDGVDDPPPE